MSIKIKCPNQLVLELDNKPNGIFPCPKTCPRKVVGRCKSKFFSSFSLASDNEDVDISLVSNNNGSSNISNGNTSNNSTNGNISTNNSNDNKNSSSNNTTNSTSNKTAKYNQILLDDLTPEQKESVTNNSIFANVRTLSFNDVCLKIDDKIFHTSYVDGFSSGNAYDALQYIFKKWRTSLVFTADGKKYVDNFLEILNVTNYSSFSKQLEEIIEDDLLSINKKFFRLFYTIIYKDQDIPFYWSEHELFYGMTLPKFSNYNDFVERITKSSDYLDDILKYLDEVLIYFNETKDNFVKKLPIDIFRLTGKLSLITNKNANLMVYTFGTLDSFIENFYSIDSYENMLYKIEFLKLYELNSVTGIIKRTRTLEEFNISSGETNLTYEACGILQRFSNNAATIYNLYTTLVKEYITMFKPNHLKIGVFNISIHNFYIEVKKIIENGIVIQNEDFKSSRIINYNDLLRFELLKSLIKRGVLDYYIEQCENVQNLRYLIDKFVLKNEIDLDDYFNCNFISHYVYTKNEKVTIEKYLLNALDNNFEVAYHQILNDSIIKIWIDNNYNSQKVSNDIINAVKIMRECEEK